MEILHKLSLNKHPRDCDNYSLVNAMNIKVTADGSTITNEEGTVENTFIKDFLTNYYGSNGFSIIAIIPCNIELVIIAKIGTGAGSADIFRYREKSTTTEEDIKLVYSGLNYHGGEIKGTFTYNVENSLIVAIAEYGVPDVKIPLRTINLGNYDNENIHNDLDNTDDMLAINPEVRIPSFAGVEYISGSAYKGWYYLFIRFKVNSVDYTQWYPFGYPVYVDTINKKVITKYVYNQKTKYGEEDVLQPDNPDDGFVTGFSDSFSDTTDIANESFKIGIQFNSNTYSKYQIGVVCCSKSYTKSWRSADIVKQSNIENYILNIANLIEHSVEDLITYNYNFFNVKNITNYKNRLYISGYEESGGNDKHIDRSIIDNIKVDLVTRTISDYSLVYDNNVISSEDWGGLYKDSSDVYVRSKQTDVYVDGKIPLDKYLGIDINTKITVTVGSTSYTDYAYAFILTKVTKLDYNFYILYKQDNFIEIKLAESKDTNVVILIHNTANNSVIINTTYTEIGTYPIYINPLISFNDRKLNSTLIPGEVYNFFIHFVDKYGNATNGYRIDNNNNTKYVTEDDPYTSVVCFYHTYNGTRYVACVRFEDLVAKDVNGRYTINTDNMYVYTSLITADDGSKVLTNTVPTQALLKEIRNDFAQKNASYANLTYSNIYWYQIIDQIPDNFGVYINNNGDKLFKVPFNTNYTEHTHLYPGDTVNGSFGSFVDNRILKISHDYTIYNAKFSNIIIPDGYIGYYISYEKFESISKITGVLTKSDFRTQDIPGIQEGNVLWDKPDVVYVVDNVSESDNMYLYSSLFDISDEIKLDYNMIRIEAKNCYKVNDISNRNYRQRGDAYKYVHDMNKPQILEYGTDVINYAMPEYKLAIADSVYHNRMGVGTALAIKNDYGLFPVYEPTLEDNKDVIIYRASVCNVTRDLYMSNSKNLIRLTDVQYNTNELTVRNGYNGHYSYDGFIVYHSYGLSFNETDNVAYTLKTNEKYYNGINGTNPFSWIHNAPFAAYFQLPICTDVFFESKSFRNAPKGIIYKTKVDSNDASKNKFNTGCIVTPANSIDLFENKQGSSDRFAVKTYTEFRDDLISVDLFSKTVRRSNIIQDESRENAWRKWSIEAYKNIAENKGSITNLIGLGTAFLVHTEHSLFIFDVDNVLQTTNKYVQTTQGDTFDVAYKEVFTSELGFGGLQDDKAWIAGEFGYIYFDNDSRRLICFDANKFSFIDADIRNYINKRSEYNTFRFGEDKDNNRILICATVDGGLLYEPYTLSFNHSLGNFVSLHDYYFVEAYNTKNKLYMQCVPERHIGCSLHMMDKTKYNIYSNTITHYDRFRPSRLSVICKDHYNRIKHLEFVTYKMNTITRQNYTKYDNTIEGYPRRGINIDYNGFPLYYFGSKLRVHNDIMDTGLLAFDTYGSLLSGDGVGNKFNDYTKPYFHLGNWHWNYIRDDIANYDGDAEEDKHARLAGNYFVFTIEVDNASDDANAVFEFEDVECHYSV